MTMPDREWELYEAAWRTASERVDPAPLRRLVAAQRRRLVAVTLGEAAIVAGCGLLSWWVASDGIEAWELIWLLTLWGFAVVASAFALWNRRGTWRNLGESVEDHVRLARLRAARKGRAAVFACGLFVAEAVAVVLQLAWLGRLTAAALGLLLVTAAGFAAGGWLAYRRSRREKELLASYMPSSEPG